MAEQIAAHISLNPYADNMSPVLNYKVKTGFQNIDAKKHQCPDDKQPQVFIGDIVIDDILGNDRVKKVAARHNKGAGHIQNKKLQMGFVEFCKFPYHNLHSAAKSAAQIVMKVF